MILRILGLLLILLALAALIGWLKLRGPDIPYATLESKYTDASSHFVDLPGGFHAHYRDDGPAQRAPVILLLHGYGDSYTSWEGWVQALKSKYRLLSLDFPGHGLTRAPDGTVLKGEVLADFVQAFADKLALPKVIVAGNSMGGGVAWQFTVHHPERVSALVLVDAAGFANEAPPAEIPLAFKILQYPIGRALLRNIDNRPLIREGLKTDVVDKSLISDAVVDRWAEFQRAPGHRAILMSMSIGAASQADPAVLSKIAVPTLILWGESDPLIEVKAAHKFANAIPAAQLIVYPNVGHLPQIEIPERSALDVERFVDALY